MEALRAGVPPIPIVPTNAFPGGLGSVHQPSHEVLLREVIGIADTATRAIANRTAGIPLEVYVERRAEAGTTEDEVLDDHPLAMLLERPHPNLTRAQLARLTTQWITSVGEAYWLKVGNGFGVPAELHPMPPGMVEPIVRQNVIAGYVVTDGDGKRLPVPADAMVRFWFPDPENPWRSEGYFGPNGVVADARRFANEHLRRHYQTNATPPLALESGETATAFTAEQREAFRLQWNQFYSRRYGSADGAPVILPLAYKVVELAMQTGAEMEPLLRFWQDELLLAYGVPRSVLGQVVSGDRSSAETNQWVFDRYTVKPLTDLIADTLTLQLAPDFDPRIKVRFEAFVSEDKEFELKRELQDLEHGVRTINQVLTDRAQDEVPWGEKPTVKSGIGVYDPDAPKPVAPGPVAPGEPPDDDAPETDPERIERQAHAAVRKLARLRKSA